MSEHEQPIAPVQLKVSGKTLALIIAGGLLAGALIVLGAIMPIGRSPALRISSSTLSAMDFTWRDEVPVAMTR